VAEILSSVPLFASPYGPPRALLDFESLGGDRPAILGLGVAAFGCREGSDGAIAPWACPLYSAWPISTRGQEEAGRTSDHGTIGWWLSQSAAVREAAARGLGHGSREGLPDLKQAVRRAWQAGQAIGVRTWWAKPAGFDMWLWRLLVGEHVGAEVVGKTRDARTLWEAAELLGGPRIEEPRLPGGEAHDPGADALATAAACADALAALLRAGRTLAGLTAASGVSTEEA
jgi:hypothetical protein